MDVKTKTRINIFLIHICEPKKKKSFADPISLHRMISLKVPFSLTWLVNLEGWPA